MNLKSYSKKRIVAGVLALTLAGGMFTSLSIPSEAACRHQWAKVSEEGGSCTTKGTIQYKCYACGKTKTEPSSAMGHDWKVVNQKDATCTEEGHAKKRCTRCNMTMTETLKKLRHNYMELSRTEATCKENGSVTRKCSICGETKTVNTPKKWHTYTVKTVSPTCTAVGEVTKVCSVCGETGRKKAINPLGHLYDANGRCARCGDTKTSSSTQTPAKPSTPTTKPSTPAAKPASPCAKGHTMVTNTVKKATCTAAGTTQQVCKVCGAKGTTGSIKALGHAYKNHQCTRCKAMEKLNGANALIACCDWYCKRLDTAVAKKEKWVYSNKNSVVKQSGTFNDMLNKKGGAKYRGGNCASLANWSLREMGVIAKSHGFWGSGSSSKYGRGIKGYNCGGTEVKKEFDAAGKVINMKGKTFKSLVKDGKIKPGDICFTYTSYNHTFIYRGGKTFYASGHDSKWHKDSKVKTDDANKAVFESWTRSFSSCSDYNAKIAYVYRMDSNYYPKYYRDVNGKLVKNGK